MAESVLRRSAVSFAATPARTQRRDHWTVVLEYEDEGQGLRMVDLSHRPRWDLQHADIDGLQPWGLRLPDVPGRCILEKGLLINRMNRTQASVWHLAGETPQPPQEPAGTDVTDATAAFALIGREVFLLLEKLASLDFLNPSKAVPFLLQGPISRVACQCVVLKRSQDDAGIVFTCPRGYGEDMVAAIVDAGAEFGLRPAGEDAFAGWLNLNVA